MLLDRIRPSALSALSSRHKCPLPMSTVRKILKISTIVVGIQEIIFVILQMVSKKQKAEVKKNTFLTFQ
jgi:hypothetical protein